MQPLCCLRSCPWLHDHGPLLGFAPSRVLYLNLSFSVVWTVEFHVLNLAVASLELYAVEGKRDSNE